MGTILKVFRDILVNQFVVEARFVDYHEEKGAGAEASFMRRLRSGNAEQRSGRLWIGVMFLQRITDLDISGIRARFR